MAKIITFSRYFPAGHPRAGLPTYFVEKLLKGFPIRPDALDTSGIKTDDLLNPKLHTIRKGDRWKEGDFFSPRFWSGLPRRSKQVVIAPDQRIVKIMNFTIKGEACYLDDRLLNQKDLIKLAANDGLTLPDFQAWFPEDFNGQVICWVDINY
jgi:hypothetical protein